MALNLSTEALARASARRPWLVVGAWVAVFAVSVALTFHPLSDAPPNEFGFTGNPDSKQADTLLEERLRGPEKVNEIVIVRSADETVDAPAFKAFVEGLYADVTALGPGVIEQGASYYQTGDESLVSADRRTTILPFVMAGDADGIPIALVVLVIVFGAITAALLPLVLGIFSIVVAVGLTALLGQAFEFSFFATNVITMMGLAGGHGDSPHHHLPQPGRRRDHRRHRLGACLADAPAGPPGHPRRQSERAPSALHRPPR